MAKTASKKTVDNKLSFEFSIRENEVIERENFGAFEVVKTKKGIMYKNYTGYHIFVTPYAVGLDGKAHETSLYAWLDNLLQTKKAFDGHLEEPFEDAGITKGDLLNADKIITESNLSWPMTAFIDVEKAASFANDYMKWLNAQQEKLQKVMSEDAPEEDLKAQAEFEAREKELTATMNMIKEQG